ncbi:uncharacterized protein LOC134686061 [Mytilus trossulus]|uniref:uncharacterized protein LOC134686061 n=1 Tax=Mytilus trossulus TaxID=6551 RepID=UPI003006B235
MIAKEFFILIWGLRFFSCINDLDNLNQLHWKITKLPVVFHSNVTLSCKVPASMQCCEKTRKWKGGKSQKLLMFNGSSANSSKYQEVVKKNGFDLEIKDFTEDDMNVNYSCFYEFLSYSKNLTIEEISYKIEPRNITVNLHCNITTGEIAVQVSVGKVYPFPECKTVFTDMNISADTHVSEVKIGLAYQISIVSAFILNTEKLDGKFKLICEDYLLVNKDLHNICESSTIVKGDNSGSRCCCRTVILFYVMTFSIYQFMLSEANLL